MLKKLSVLFIILGVVIGFIIVIIISNKKNIKDEYYTILENKSYVMKENREIIFNIYSKKDKSLITYESENKYYLILENLKYNLENVKIAIYDLDDIYLYKINAKLPVLPDSISSSMYLEIDNPKFSLLLNYGTISLLCPKEYELISLDDLYASYTIINGIKRICGINITFSNTYKIIDEVNVGTYTNGILSKTLYDLKLPNEINIYDYISDYKYNDKNNNHRISLKSNTLFIPLSSPNDYITKEGYITFIIDKKKYYLDTFSFMVGDLDINSYNMILEKGAITYV